LHQPAGRTDLAREVKRRPEAQGVLGIWRPARAETLALPLQVWVDRGSFGASLLAAHAHLALRRGQLWGRIHRRALHLGDPLERTLCGGNALTNRHHSRGNEHCDEHFPEHDRSSLRQPPPSMDGCVCGLNDLRDSTIE
jgi:hypothetical protein